MCQLMWAQAPCIVIVAMGRLTSRCKVSLLVVATILGGVILLRGDKQPPLPPWSPASPTWSSVQQRVTRSSTVSTHSSGETNSSSAGCILPKVAIKSIYLPNLIIVLSLIDNNISVFSCSQLDPFDPTILQYVSDIPT